MKLFFASDLHGSVFYTKVLIEKFLEEKAEKLVLLGDLLYHGPRNPLTKEYNPLEVSLILNQYKDRIICVRGNCDSEVDQMILDFPIMSDFVQLFCDNNEFFLSHGHLYNPEDFKSREKFIYVFGHIHLPVLKRENIIQLNPGSVALPKDGNESTYAVYDNGVIRIKTLKNEIIKELIL